MPSSVCAKCARQNAKFCAHCGAKLPRRENAVKTTRLPALEPTRPSTVANALRSSPEMPPPVVRAVSPLRNKRPLPPAKTKPTRLAKLETGSTAVCAPRVREPEPIEDRDHRLKIWMASTRRLLESVLELKRRLGHPEFEDIDPTRFQSIDRVLQALRHDLDLLEPCFVLDRNLQAKCVAMLAQLSKLYQEARQQLRRGHFDAETSPQREQRASKSPSKPSPLSITDAEVVIRGPDGKQFFFRARKKSPARIPWALDSEHGTPNFSVADEPIQCCARSVDTSVLLANDADRSGEERVLSPSVVQPRMTEFLRERWSDMLVFRVARVSGRVVLARLQESDELHQLEIDLYRPISSWRINVCMPLEWLAFVLPPSILWFRVSEIRRCKTVEAHWSRCFNYILRCLRWTPAGDAITTRFPIQFRQARMFTFRSFATFHGLLSINVLPPDYALQVTFLNARTHERVTLTLHEKEVTRCLAGSDSYRECLVGTATRKTLCMQVCDKLFFEYTSRGFELLFPGIKPKGTIRRHPQELSVAQHRADQLENGRETLKAVLDACIEQTVVIARRRMESYLDRVQRAKKARQDAAAKKIQARTRSLVAKRKMRRERDELRRASRLQELAAVLIQREFRRRHQQSQQRRALEKAQRDVRGVRFRLSARVNGTFLLVNVVLDELDGAANAFDLVLGAVHPSTSQAAQLRVPYSDVVRRLRTASLVGRPRSEIVRSVVCDHVDVFRSARHGVLVLALRT